MVVARRFFTAAAAVAANFFVRTMAQRQPQQQRQQQQQQQQRLQALWRNWVRDGAAIQFDRMQEAARLQLETERVVAAHMRQNHVRFEVISLNMRIGQVRVPLGRRTIEV